MPVRHAIYLLPFCLLLGLATPLAHAQECNTSWAAPVDGLWTEDANWTGGQPEGWQTACITVDGEYTVILPPNASSSTGRLLLGGASGTQTVRMQGALHLVSGTSIIGENGVLVVERISGTVGLSAVGTLLVEGALSQRQSTSLLSTDHGGTLDVAPGGRLELIGGANAGGATSLFRIRGTLEASNCAGGSGNCQMNSPIEVDGGTIRVASGQLDLRRTGSLKDVTFDVSEGARLWINANQTPSAERVFTVEGTIAGNPAGDVDFVGVDFDAGHHEVTFDMGGTGMRFAGVNGRAAALTGTTGSFVNVNVMELGGHLSVSSWGQGVRGVTLRNTGSLELTPSITLWDDARIENAAGATVRMRASTQISGEGTFENSGRLLRDVGGPTSFVNVPYHGRPGSTIEMLAGRIDLRDGGSLDGAAFVVAEGATLSMLGQGDVRLWTLDGTLSGEIEGLLRWWGSDFAAGPSNPVLNFTGTGLQFSGQFGRPTQFTDGGGTLTNLGHIEVGGSSGWGIGSLDATLINEGVIELGYTFQFWEEGALLRNQPDGVIRSMGGWLDGRVDQTVVGTFENHGLLTRGPGTTASVQVAYHGRPGSSISVPVGRIELQRGGSFEDASFAVAEGADLWVRGMGDDRLWTLDGTLSGEIEGLLRWWGADFAAGPSNPVLDFTGEGLQFSGQVGRATQFTNGGGILTNVGRISLAGSSGSGIGARGATVVNEGLIELIYPFRFWEDGVLRNQPNGVIRMANAGFGGGNVGADNDGIVENHGLITRDGNTTAVGFNSTLRSQPGSELRVLTGRLDLDPPGEHSFPEGTTVTGTTQVRLLSGLTVGGTISPGTAEQPIVTQEYVTSLQMSATTRTVIDIDAGGQSDTIIPASGINSTTLGGTLVVRLAPGFTPSPGDEWVIFLRSANPYMIQGEFDAIEVEGDVPDGLGFVTEKPNAGVVVLRAVSGATIHALAESTVEGGPPVQFVISVANPVPPGSVVEIPLAFEGAATRYVDYVVDITGNTARIPAGQTSTTITLFPLADDEEEGDETVTIQILEGGDVAPGSPDAATIVIEDGPLTSTLAVGGVAPSRGGNGGTVTATVFGQGFGENAVVRLQQGGTIVTGTNVVVNEFGTGLTARFDLSGAPLGSYDVVVESGGDGSTLPGSFTVEAPSGLELWADITGTPNPRQFRWSTYTLTVGNTGNQDIHDTAVLVRISPGIEYEITGVLDIDDVWDLPPDPEDNDHIGLNVETATVVPLYLYRIPAGDVNVITIRIRPTTAVGTGAGVSYELYPPDPFGAFTWSGDFEDIDQDTADGFYTNWVITFGAITWAVDFLLGDDLASNAPSRRMSYDEPGLRAGGLNNPWDDRPWEDLLMPDLIAYYAWATNLGDNPMDALTVAILASTDKAITITMNPAVTAAALHAALVWGGPVAIGFAALRQGLATALFASGERAPGRIVCKFVGAPGCTDPPGNGGGGGGGTGGGGSSTGGPGNGPGGGFGGGAGGKVGGAVDPNDKLGPAGFEEFRYFRTEDPLFYLIRYENLDTATFPAQEVIIIDDLDTSVYDLSTFRLGPITLPDRVVTPPAGVQSFHTVLDLAPELPALLVINAGIDLEMGRAVWTFVTLDPDTMDLPEDGMVGFLPPNVNQPEGEGAVAFAIEMLPELSTNTDVANLAEIYFDLNDPIITPVWSNRVDRDPPNTTVVPLPPVSESPLTIEIAGADIGSGIQIYTLFVSTDGGPFQLYATSTEPSFEFQGELDVQYGFYSIGVDYVMNVEGPKSKPETTTLIGSVSTEGGPDLPRELTLHSPYPNPTTRSATLSWGLPAAAEPDIRIYDVLGREVLRLLDGTPRQAGWHETRLDGSLASGVYVVRLTAERDGRVETRTQRLVVVR